MNAALNYCWKEWRAQRGLLIAYTLLVFAALCLGLYLAPRHYWFDEGFGVHAVSWFVSAACIGVIAFVVPNLVRAEFTNKEDQFVRRLPGALRPAFYGKLLFLVLVTIAMPLIGLLAGELFVTVRGGDWSGLFAWDWQGNVSMHGPDILVGMGLALLLLPWIWAVGLWVPGGRLALLGATLLALILGVGVFAVMRQSPNIMEGVAWQSWLWAVPVSGVIAAAASWLKGRRGGGPLRSARFGLLSLSVMLLPGAVWLGERAWRYHHPDLTNLEGMSVFGCSPDGRYLLAHGTENTSWQCVVARIDLETGEAQQATGIAPHVTPETVAPDQLRGSATQRFWRGWAEDENFILDLETGERRPIEVDGSFQAVLPADLARLVRQDRGRVGRLVAPGGVRVRCEDGHFVFESRDGTVERAAWPFEIRSYHVAGHGVKIWCDGRWRLYGFAERRLRDTDGRENAWFVGSKIVALAPRPVVRRGRREPKSWFIYHESGEREPCEELCGATLLGLLDDERVLAFVSRHDQPSRLFTFDPATAEVQDVQLPATLAESSLPWTSVRRIAPMNEFGSLLPRDPANHVWLRYTHGSNYDCLRLDAESLVATGVRMAGYSPRAPLITWQELPRIVQQDGLDVVETNIETGARRTLFRGGKERAR